MSPNLPPDSRGAALLSMDSMAFLAYHGCLCWSDAGLLEFATDRRPALERQRVMDARRGEVSMKRAHLLRGKECVGVSRHFLLRTVTQHARLEAWQSRWRGVQHAVTAAETAS